MQMLELFSARHTSAWMIPRRSIVITTVNYDNNTITKTKRTLRTASPGIRLSCMNTPYVTPRLYRESCQRVRISASSRPYIYTYWKWSGALPPLIITSRRRPNARVAICYSRLLPIVHSVHRMHVYSRAGEPCLKIANKPNRQIINKIWIYWLE